ncbi:MAG: hypothetical protein ACO1SX_10515 [Actinomycetota bacterium]
MAFELRWRSALRLLAGLTGVARRPDICGDAMLNRDCTYEIWEHGQSGEVFAVRLDAAGRITGCRGPLVSEQLIPVEPASYEYDEDPDSLTWLEATREHWEPFAFQALDEASADL